MSEAAKQDFIQKMKEWSNNPKVKETVRRIGEDVQMYRTLFPNADKKTFIKWMKDPAPGQSKDEAQLNAFCVEYLLDEGYIEF